MASYTAFTCIGTLTCINESKNKAKPDYTILKSNYVKSMREELETKSKIQLNQIESFEQRKHFKGYEKLLENELNVAKPNGDIWAIKQ